MGDSEGPAFAPLHYAGWDEQVSGLNLARDFGGFRA